MPKKYQEGFASILLVLVFVGILALAYSFKNYKNKISQSLSKTAVLSESSGGDSEKNGSDSSSGSGSSGSSNQTVTTVSSNETETPEPSKTPEATETPEPKETLEPKVQEAEVETEVKDGTLSAKIKIQKGNALQFEQDKSSVQVQGDFPLSVNQTTKELTINTPSGTKTVAILPDSAVQSVLAAGIVSQVSTNDQTGKNEVKITTDANGNVVYEINGVKFEKLLGVINVSINKTAQISAQNGENASVNESLLSKLLDTLSF